MHDHLGKNIDARGILDAQRHDRDDGGSRRYRPWCYDPEDRSPSPKPPGLRVFSEVIRRAWFSTQFRQPTNIAKYSGETNPELWLTGYRLACQLGSADQRMTTCSSGPYPRISGPSANHTKGAL